MRTPRTFGWLFLATVLALTVFPLFSAFGDSTQALFIIQRSKNANEVHYDAQVGGDGALSKDPVVAYWIMKAEDGRREGLSFMEKKMAYGFDVSSPNSAGECNMKLVAYKDRTIKLTKASGKWRGVTTINGKDAFLTKLFIQTKEGGVMPTVLYVDLFGEEVNGGKAVQEHVVMK